MKNILQELLQEASKIIETNNSSHSYFNNPTSGRELEEVLRNTTNSSPRFGNISNEVIK